MRSLPAPHRRQLAQKEGSVSCLDWGGDGPLLHFAHANGFNAQTYAHLLAPLSERFHILASDARGHGFTELPTEAGSAKNWDILARDLAETLDTIHAGPVILAGHSLGAVTSMKVAAAHPARVRGLVLIEPVLVPENSIGPGPALGIMTRKRRAQFASFDAALAAYRGRGAFASWPADMLRDYLLGGLKPVPGGVALACDPSWEAEIYDGNPIGAAKLARSVTCPITLMYGDSDSTAPESEVQIIAQQQNVRVVNVPGASHFLPMEKPELVRAEIARMTE